MEMYRNVKKYFVLGAILLGIVSILTCFGSGVTANNGNIDWCVFELIYGNLANAGTAVAWYLMLLGIVLAGVVAALAFLKKDNKIVSLLSLADSTVLLVSGILFGAVQAFCSKDIGAGSVMVCIMVIAAACCMLVGGADILLNFASTNEGKKSYRRY